MEPGRRRVGVGEQAVEFRAAPHSFAAITAPVWASVVTKANGRTAFATAAPGVDPERQHEETIEQLPKGHTFP